MTMKDDALKIQLAEARATHIENYAKHAPYVDRCEMKSNDMGDICITMRHINFEYMGPVPKNFAKVIRAKGFRARV